MGIELTENGLSANEIARATSASTMSYRIVFTLTPNIETATYLRRPALQGVEPQLLSEFGDEIRGDRWKQLVGRMVRQIMERNGYSLDQSGVRIRNGQLFTSAARYRPNQR